MTIAFIFFRQEIHQNPLITDFILAMYFLSLLILFTFGVHGFVMVYHYLRMRKEESQLPEFKEEPIVTIQLPVYNELYVVRRLIDSVCSMDYPKDKLEIQVLDDSTDETVDIAAEGVEYYQKLGFDIKHIRRPNRQGFKAGALKHGLALARGEYIAIFDADFVPRHEFLKQTLPYFYQDKKIGLVQTRW